MRALLAGAIIRGNENMAMQIYSHLEIFANVSDESKTN